jgi:phosphoribosylglycinamide formyltransferase-1
MSEAASAPGTGEEALPAIAVLVSGRGSNLGAICEAVARGEVRARVALVVSSRHDAPALDRAVSYGIACRVIAPKEYASRAEAGAALVQAIREAGAQLIVLAGYKPILDSCVIQSFPRGIINIHPSLLPAFAGGMAPRPQAEALAAGVKLTGCTVHFVTEDVDAGPIITQASVPVLDDDTVESLSERILAEEHRLLPATIARLLSGRVHVEGRRVIVSPAG